MAEFDAVSYAADVFCNGSLVGRHLGLWTPFAVDLTSALQPGANTLELAVTKPSHALTGGAYPMRTTLAGFLPDVATTFGGLWQGARLRVVEHGFADLQVDADPQLRRISVAAVPVTPPATPPTSASPVPLLLQIEVKLCRYVRRPSRAAGRLRRRIPGAVGAAGCRLLVSVPRRPSIR